MSTAVLPTPGPDPLSLFSTGPEHLCHLEPSRVLLLLSCPKPTHPRVSLTPQEAGSREATCSSSSAPLLWVVLGKSSPHTEPHFLRPKRRAFGLSDFRSPFQQKTESERALSLPHAGLVRAGLWRRLGNWSPLFSKWSVFNPLLAKPFQLCWESWLLKYISVNLAFYLNDGSANWV